MPAVWIHRALNELIEVVHVLEWIHVLRIVLLGRVVDVSPHAPVREAASRSTKRVAAQGSEARC